MTNNIFKHNNVASRIGLEISKMLVDVDSRKQFEEYSRIVPGMMVGYLHDPGSNGMVISSDHEGDTTKVLWTIPPDLGKVSYEIIKEAMNDSLSSNYNDVLKIDESLGNLEVKFKSS